VDGDGDYGSGWWGEGGGGGEHGGGGGEHLTPMQKVICNVDHN